MVGPWITDAYLWVVSWFPYPFEAIFFDDFWAFYDFIFAHLGQLEYSFKVQHVSKRYKIANWMSGLTSGRSKRRELWVKLVGITGSFISFWCALGFTRLAVVQPSHMKSIPKWKFQNIHVHLYLEILLSFGKVFDLDISASPLENAKKYCPG